MKRYDKIILLLLLVVFAVGIFLTARNALSTYVTFADAQATSRAVQVKGVAIEGTVEELGPEKYAFDMKDNNDEIVRVVANGEVPANLFEAESVVVKGKYQDSEFIAQNILVKCPSKYEAEEHPEEINKE
ncbi:MAG: cytochrome c maturation protein CcmE [Firmicutes bacterium]|nr:cytochrome c maturation protein CcmE [Bacillota bacterium]